MENINIIAIVESVEKSQSGYKEAIKELVKVTPYQTFTAKEVGIAGQTLAWLAKYGVLKVVDKKTEFICIDSWDETYKKVLVNVYQANCDIKSLALEFDTRVKEFKVQKIEDRIKYLKDQLAQAIIDLEKIQ